VFEHRRRILLRTEQIETELPRGAASRRVEDRVVRLERQFGDPAPVGSAVGVTGTPFIIGGANGCFQMVFVP